jgi:hypothetical protein
MNTMTPEEFKNEMLLIARTSKGDVEIMHSEMDLLMCKLLESLGYDDGTYVFRMAQKWYA